MDTYHRQMGPSHRTELGRGDRILEVASWIRDTWECYEDVSFEPVEQNIFHGVMFVLSDQKIRDCCVGMLWLSKSASMGGSMVQTLLKKSESFEKGGEMKLNGSS